VGAPPLIISEETSLKGLKLRLAVEQLSGQLGSIHERSYFLTWSAPKSNDETSIVNQIKGESGVLFQFLNIRSKTGMKCVDIGSQVKPALSGVFAETWYRQESA